MLALGLVAIALGFLMAGHYPPWMSFEHQWVAAFGALLVGGTTMRGCAWRSPLAVTALPVVAATLGIVPLAQFALGQVWFVSDAVLTATYLVAFAATVVAGKALAERSAAFIDGLMYALLAAAAISALIALLQWQQLRPSFFVIDLKPGGRPYANLAQPNHLATLIALGIMAALRFYEARRFSGVTAAVLLALLGWGLVMTQSRTGWVFAGLLVLWWLWQRRRVGLLLSPPCVTVGIAAFVAAVWAWQPLNEALLMSSGSSLEDRLQSGWRPVHWATLWDAAWRQPWLGYGWSNVVLAQQAAVLDHPPTTEWLLQSHNLVLDLMIYNGIPLGLAVAGFLTWWLVRQIRSCRTVDQWALIGAVGAVLLHALLEYPLDYLYFLLPTGLMMGALEALNETPGPSIRLPRAGFAVVLAALATMVFWVGAEYLKVESAVRQLRFVLLGIGVEKVPEAPVPDVLLLDQPREFHRLMRTRARENMSPAELEWMRRVAMRLPTPPAVLRYALAAGLNHRHEEAAFALARICHMNPAQRCDEGRASWAALQQQYPTLLNVPYPATPPELEQLVPSPH